jgi:hypothetical protein
MRSDYGKCVAFCNVRKHSTVCPSGKGSMQMKTNTEAWL